MSKLKNTSDILYTNEKKRRVREYLILPSVLKTKSLLDFLGAAEMYHLTKERTQGQHINHLSIDNDPTKRKLISKLPDAKAISLKELCQQNPENKFGTIWIDYCGQFNYYVNEDLSQIRNIMTQEGDLFMTFFNRRESVLPKGTKRSRIMRYIITQIKEYLAEQSVISDCIQAWTYKSYVYHEKTKKMSKKPCDMIVYKFIWRKLEETSDKVLTTYKTPIILDLDEQIEEEQSFAI